MLPEPPYSCPTALCMLRRCGGKQGEARRHMLAAAACGTTEVWGAPLPSAANCAPLPGRSACLLPRHALCRADRTWEKQTHFVFMHAWWAAWAAPGCAAQVEGAAVAPLQPSRGRLSCQVSARAILHRSCGTGGKRRPPVNAMYAQCTPLRRCRSARPAASPLAAACSFMGTRCGRPTAAIPFGCRAPTHSHAYTHLTNHPDHLPAQPPDHPRTHPDARPGVIADQLRLRLAPQLRRQPARVVAAEAQGVHRAKVVQHLRAGGQPASQPARVVRAVVSGTASRQLAEPWERAQVSWLNVRGAVMNTWLVGCQPAVSHFRVQRRPD